MKRYGVTDHWPLVADEHERKKLCACDHTNGHIYERTHVRIYYTSSSSSLLYYYHQKLYISTNNSIDFLKHPNNNNHHHDQWNWIWSELHWNIRVSVDSFLSDENNLRKITIIFIFSLFLLQESVKCEIHILYTRMMKTLIWHSSASPPHILCERKSISRSIDILNFFFLHFYKGNKISISSNDGRDPCFDCMNCRYPAPSWLSIIINITDGPLWLIMVHSPSMMQQKKKWREKKNI